MQPWTMAKSTLPAFSFIDVAAGAEKKAERPEEGSSLCNPIEAAAVLALLKDLHVRLVIGPVWSFSEDHQDESANEGFQHV